MNFSHHASRITLVIIEDSRDLLITPSPSYRSLPVSYTHLAVFIKASFPYELENASHEYLRLNLRDQVVSQIPIDVPEKGDYRFHLETDNDES